MKDEARMRREKRKKYEALLEDHPAVKAMRARIVPRPTPEVKPGVPKLIAEAMQNKDAATFITTMQRVMKYHNRARDLERRHLRGETIPLKEQNALMQQGENIESDFRDLVRSAARTARTNPATEAYATAIASRTYDMEVVDNLPSFLSRSELAAIKYLGVEPQEFREQWNNLYPRRRHAMWEVLASGRINQALERVEKFAERLEFPEAPHHLVERGILTNGGEWKDYLVIGGVLYYVGNILSYFPYIGWIGSILVIVGTVFLGVGVYELVTEYLAKVAAAKEAINTARDTLTSLIEKFSEYARNEMERLKQQGEDWINQLRNQLIAWLQGPEAQEGEYVDKFRAQFDVQIKEFRSKLMAEIEQFNKNVNAQIRQLNDQTQAMVNELKEVIGISPEVEEFISYAQTSMHVLQDIITSMVSAIRGGFDQAVADLLEEIPSTCKLSITVNGQGTTSPSLGTHTYVKGQSVTVTASPASGWAFGWWHGDLSGTSPKHVITMSYNMSFIATFAPLTGALYIANRNSKEIHKSDCFWVTRMNEDNKIPCSSIGEVSNLITESAYNGCFYCLSQYDTG